MENIMITEELITYVKDETLKENYIFALRKFKAMETYRSMWWTTRSFLYGNSLAISQPAANTTITNIID